MTTSKHRKASAETAVRCAVITASDSRTVETDTSGAYILETLKRDGHTVASYEIVPDDYERIRKAIEAASAVADVILTSGGTGISQRDSTFEAIASMLEKTLPGFGEIFRNLSFEDIGPAAMLSRATAGVYRDTVIFSMPGSTAAVKLAMDRLILPELRHLVWELIRHRG